MNNPFQTGRTFDPVGHQLAEDILERIYEGKELHNVLLEILKGEREPRELVAEFQNNAEAIYEHMTETAKENAKADYGDMRGDQMREDDYQEGA